MRTWNRLAAFTVMLGVVLLEAAVASANHPVLVEGNCLGTSGIVVPTSCGDYDGDGRVGTSEDADGDRVFGTINAALGPGGGGGANQNGSVTIVTSGVFPETVTITGANGNVTLQAAPGVEAIIDAVLQGVAGNAAREASPGIIVDAPSDRYVVIDNVQVRNWTTGIEVRGDSHVAIDGVRLENNVNHGIAIEDDARVAISGVEVHATGFRVSGSGDFPRLSQPQPGTGIEFAEASSGIVSFSTVTGSFRTGIADETREQICVSHVTAFDNNPNFKSVRHGEGECNKNATGAVASQTLPNLPGSLLLLLIPAALLLMVKVRRLRELKHAFNRLRAGRKAPVISS